MKGTKHKSDAWRPPGQPQKDTKRKRRLWPPGNPPRFPGSEVWESVRIMSVPGPWVYNMPKDVGALAARLGLPVQEVVQLIDGGRVPLRRWLNKNRRPYGPPVVLIHDALKVEGIVDKSLLVGRPMGSPWARRGRPKAVIGEKD